MKELHSEKLKNRRSRLSSFAGFFIPTLTLLFPSPTHAFDGGDEKGGKDAEEKDTVAVFSLDGLFEEPELSLPRLRQKADSLRNLRPASEKVQWLENCLSQPTPSRESLVSSIDSLLNGGKVDRERMRELRILIARVKASESKRSPFMLPYGDSPYPASSLLPNWNTRRIAPYNELHADRGEREKRELRLTAPEWNCGFAVPVKGEMTSPYGERDGRKHHGIDFDLQVGDSVRTAFPGMVRVSRYFGGYGKVVIVRHPNGLETLYAHLYRSEVSTGERVRAGEMIGRGGNTGHSTGSHLHFEVRYKGVSLDPSHFIAFDENELMGDTLKLKEQRYGYASYPEGTRYHEVELGDYLYGIAKRYGVSVRKLCELNDIHRNAMLHVGQRIRISS